jgi:hypothetical protein
MLPRLQNPDFLMFTTLKVFKHGNSWNRTESEIFHSESSTFVFSYMKDSMCIWTSRCITYLAHVGSTVTLLFAEGFEIRAGSRQFTTFPSSYAARPAVGQIRVFKALQPLWTLASFHFPALFTIGRTPWTSDQLVARPLPKHRQDKHNKHIYTPNINALSWIRTHDHGLQAREDSSCIRPLGYRDWRRCVHVVILTGNIYVHGNIIGFHKLLGICCVAERLLASKQKRSFSELDNIYA